MMLNKCRAQRPAVTLVFLLPLLFLLAVKPCPGAEILDDDAVVHHFEKPFSRIISLYPAHTENIVEMGATGSLIGISTGDTLPAGFSEIEKFSYHDTAEKFIAAHPDCILIRPMISQSTPNLIRKLRDYGITVISLQPTSSSELFSYWHSLGLITGRIRESDEMTTRFTSRLTELSRKVAAIEPQDRPRVYFEAIHTRMKTFSPQSIAMFCLTSAGGINIADDAVPRRQTNIAAYGKERILSHAADIDIFLAQSGRMNRISVDEILNEPGFGAIKAIREKRVHLVSEDLVSRPTSKLIEGILYVHSLLYQDPPQ